MKNAELNQFVHEASTTADLQFEANRLTRRLCDLQNKLPAY